MIFCATFAMESRTVLVLCLFIAAAAGRTVSKVDPAGGSCILDVNNDLPTKNEPLLLGRNGNTLSFLIPEAEGHRGILALREGEEILIACPGNRNALAATNEEVSRAVCTSGKSLVVDGKKIESTELDCTGRASADVEITKKRCAAGKGIIIELGFRTNGWQKIMEVCHNIETSETYYAHHTINGASLAGKVFRPVGTRPSFDRGHKTLYPGGNPNSAYNQRHQQEVLSRLLGSSRAEELFDVRASRFLARGHLAPDADFLFSPHQFSTYFYVNAAPQWQIINAGNWLRVEENTRKASMRLADDMEVVTGTYGVLKLANKKGQPKEIRLQNNRLPAPELYWKALRSTRDDSCIVFVATNNPFLEKAPKPLCEDICSTTGWPVLQNDLNKGYVYCCEFSDFRKAVPDAPNMTCEKTLRGR